MKISSRARWLARGQALVEFALVVPLLALLLFAIIQYGFIFNAYMNVRHAAFVTARSVALSGTSNKCGTWNASSKHFTPDDSTFVTDSVPAVEVISQRAVTTYFAKLFGFPTMTARAQSIAIAARATAGTSLMPWAVCRTGGPPAPCETVTLKFSDVGDGNPCSNPGNYGALEFGGPGGSNYRDNIENGYQGIVRIGDVIPTKTGNMVGPTRQGLDARISGAPPYNCDPANPVVPSPRLAIVIVTTPAGSDKHNVVVTDFWVFAMDDPQGGQVTGKYLQVFTGTEIDPSKPPVSGGLAGVALVN
jgi:Flp pilus assembly protein TadG